MEKRERSRSPRRARKNADAPRGLLPKMMDLVRDHAAFHPVHGPDASLSYSFNKAVLQFLHCAIVRRQGGSVKVGDTLVGFPHGMPRYWLENLEKLVTNDVMLFLIVNVQSSGLKTALALLALQTILKIGWYSTAGIDAFAEAPCDVEQAVSKYAGTRSLYVQNRFLDNFTLDQMEVLYTSVSENVKARRWVWNDDQDLEDIDFAFNGLKRMLYYAYSAGLAHTMYDTVRRHRGDLGLSAVEPWHEQDAELAEQK